MKITVNQQETQDGNLREEILDKNTTRSTYLHVSMVIIMLYCTVQYVCMMI